ncbi:hypothetical protein LCM4579_23525 [Ensifer sp. LCM 4579]|nr:hypothetical protein LCM4579_23525 [Ensifer sp. LCM 4579]
MFGLFCLLPIITQGMSAPGEMFECRDLVGRQELGGLAAAVERQDMKGEFPLGSASPTSSQPFVMASVKPQAGVCFPCKPCAEQA